jgi:translation initiation factor eIF-2B subunit beta
VIVLGAVYKLTPLYPFDFLTYNELGSPQQILPLEESDNKHLIQAIVPAYDYVPPELVSLYITNHGGQTPKYIYRIFSEFYSQEDIYDLDDEEDWKSEGDLIKKVRELAE